MGTFEQISKAVKVSNHATGWSAGLFQSAVLFPVQHCVSPVCQIKQRDAHNSQQQQLGMLRDLDGCGSGEEGGGGCSRCSRLYSHLSPQGTTHQLELT